MPRRRTANKPEAPELCNRDTLQIVERIRNKTLYNCQINSDCLESIGINEGDLILIQKADRNDESKISVWLDTKIEKPTIKIFGYATDNFGDILIENDNTLKTFKKREIKFIGFIVGVVKAFDEPNPYLTDSETIKTDETGETENTEEITVTCEGCQKTVTGSRAFLSGMCWRIRKDSTLCVSCW